MPRGSTRKREREYEELKQEFKSEGRYRGREEEVAARIVNKQRRQFGETAEAREADREGESPDRGLPLPGYDQMTVPQVVRKAADLDERARARIRAYEEKHKNRVTLLRQLDKAS